MRGLPPVVVQPRAVWFEVYQLRLVTKLSGRPEALHIFHERARHVDLRPGIR